MKVVAWIRAEIRRTSWTSENWQNSAPMLASWTEWTSTWPKRQKKCLLQAIVHFEMARASLFTDRKISGLPIRAKYRHFRTIGEHTLDSSPTDPVSSLKWWSAWHGVATLCNCWRSGLRELHSIALSEFQSASILCTLVNSPSIVEHRHSGFVQIVFNFFLILIGVRRVHGCENTDCLSLRLLPPGINLPWMMERMSWAFPKWLMFSAKSSGNSTPSRNVGSTRVPPECPWIRLKYRKCLEELGFTQYWNLFFGPPPFARKVIQASIGLCEVPSNFTFNFSARSSNFTAPSSSRWTVSSCRNNLIMNFDTSKQPWLNFPGSTSIHFRSRKRIHTGDNVKVGFGRGLDFATGFIVPLFSTLATNF